MKGVTEWCNEHNLLLNVKKTKELIFDFRKQQVGHKQLSIAGSDVDIAHSYKYLGTIIDDELSWSLNTENINNKCQQRLYFLRLLKSFGVDNTILKLFYMSIVQSVVSFNIIVWLPSIGKGSQNTLNRIHRKATKLIRDTLCNLDYIYVNNVVKKVKNIMSNTDHPFNNMYSTMRSERRLRAISCRTKRYGVSFVPNSIHIFNHV